MAIILKILLAVFWSSILWGSDKETFRSTIKNFLEKDPNFKEIDYQSSVFETQLKQGFSELLLPKINLTYGLYEQRNNVSQATAASRYKLASLTTSYNLFNFGNDYNNFQASRLENKSQQQKVLGMLIKREREISVLLLDYLKGKKNLNILEKIVKLKNRAFELSLKRYQRGTLSQQDLNKVELDVSNSRAEQMVAEQDFANLMAKINAYEIGKLPDNYPWESEFSQNLINELEKIFKSVDELPQFLELDFNLQATDHRASAALGQMLGNVSLNFSRNLFQFPDEDDLYEWRTSVVYTLPLFDKFNQKLELERRSANYLAAKVRQQFEKKLAIEVQVAEKSKLNFSWKNWLERRESLKLSTKLYTHSLSQFNQGQLSVNELLIDQDRLLRTEQVANNATFQLHQTVLSYCHSRGLTFVKGCF